MARSVLSLVSGSARRTMSESRRQGGETAALRASPGQPPVQGRSGDRRVGATAHRSAAETRDRSDRAIETVWAETAADLAHGTRCPPGPPGRCDGVRQSGWPEVGADRAMKWDSPGLPPVPDDEDRCSYHSHCQYRDDDPARCPFCHCRWDIIISTGWHSCEAPTLWNPNRVKYMVHLARIMRLTATEARQTPEQPPPG